MAETLNTDTVNRAAATVAQTLGVPAEKVSFKLGDPEDGIRDNDRAFMFNRSDQSKYTTLVMTAEMPDAALNPGPAKKAVTQKLATLEPLTSISQILPDEEIACKMARGIREVAQDTCFEMKLLDAPVFNPEVAKDRYNVRDYAISNVTSDAYGVRLNLWTTVDPNAELKPLLEKEAATLEARKEDVRKLLIPRVVKYIRLNMAAENKSADEIEKAVAKATEDMGKLLVTFKADENRHGVAVYIGTQEQAKALEKDNPPPPYDDKFKEPANAAELKACNPLHLVKDSVTEHEAKEGKSPQLHKALGRAILCALPVEDFVKIAGRRDIQTAIAKNLINNVLPKHPEKKEAIDKILDSPLFKNHDRWRTGSEPGSKDTAPPEAVVKKYVQDGDKVTVYFAIPQDKLTPTLEALAACAPKGAECAPAPQLKIADTPDCGCKEKQAEETGPVRGEDILPLILRPSFVERLKESLGWSRGAA